jgi:hypothetical protein
VSITNIIHKFLNHCCVSLTWTRCRFNNSQKVIRVIPWKKSSTDRIIQIEVTRQAVGSRYFRIPTLERIWIVLILAEIIFFRISKELLFIMIPGRFRARWHPFIHFRESPLWLKLLISSLFDWTPLIQI